MSLWVHKPGNARLNVVAANGVCSGLFFPRFFAALTLRTPPHLRARVMASATTAMSALGPLGFVGAGSLLQNSDSAIPGFLVVAAATTLGASIIGTAHLAEMGTRRSGPDGSQSWGDHLGPGRP